MSTTGTDDEANTIPLEVIAEERRRDREREERENTNTNTNSRVSNDEPIEEGEVIIDTPSLPSSSNNAVLMGDKPRTMPHKVLSLFYLLFIILYFYLIWFYFLFLCIYFY